MESTVPANEPKPIPAIPNGLHSKSDMAILPKNCARPAAVDSASSPSANTISDISIESGRMRMVNLYQKK